MSIIINGEEKRIGLALSGGGFRAAAFHLGVFRKLKEQGLLWKIDVLSCVSGGSIAGAFLAMNWGDDQVLDDLDEYLSTRSIAVSSALLGALNPFRSRLDELAKTYDNHLFHGKTLDDLKNGPRIYLNSTNMATGNMFFFVAGENKPTEMGDHDLGTIEKDFPISKAVSASSAFPPVFPPLKIEQDVFPSSVTEYITLSDGGVYDNLGVNPLLNNEYNKLDYAIVSDAGKPFEIEDEPAELGTMVLKSSINILMEQVRGLQFSKLKLSWRSENGPKPLWFSIDKKSKNGVIGDEVFASNIRTHLKKLKREELDILNRHAGELLNDRIVKYSPELLD